MKWILALLWILCPWLAFGANPSFTSFPQDQFTTNGWQIRPHGAPFTFVYMGDIHAGWSHSPSINVQAEPTAGRLLLTNSISYILSQVTNLNIKAFISSGDLVDDSSTVTQAQEFILVTNQLRRLQQAGVAIIVCNGNHENDDASWDTYMGPMLTSNPGYYTNLVPNSWRSIITLQTNSGIPFAFIATDFYDTNKTDWVTNACNFFPTHYAVALTHWWLNSHGTYLFGSLGVGGSFTWDKLKRVPNRLDIHSGHNRDAFNWAHRVDYGDRGNQITSLFFNTQENTNSGSYYIRFYTFYPDDNRVYAKTYDSLNSRWITNGESAIYPTKQTNGYFANFSYPIYESSPTIQKITLSGLVSKQQSFAHAQGNWSATLATNELFDTMLTFTMFNPDGTFLDSWSLARRFGTNALFLSYASVDDPNSGTNVAMLTPSGFTVFGGLTTASSSIGVSPTNLFNHFADAGNVSTSETVLYADNIPTNTLTATGQKVGAIYGGTFVASATATRQLKVYFSGASIFDTGALAIGTGSSWSLTVSVIRSGATTARAIASLTTGGASSSAYTFETDITGLSFTTTNVLHISGTAAGVGAASNDIVAKLGSLEWKP